MTSPQHLTSQGYLFEVSTTVEHTLSLLDDPVNQVCITRQSSLSSQSMDFMKNITIFFEAPIILFFLGLFNIVYSIYIV